jgi:hypothetical protein
MSRSFKKNSICGIAGDSDKKGKQKANRKFRRKEKMFLQMSFFNKIPIKLREVFNVYDLPKDGKAYFGKLKNKDFKLFLKLLRK